MPRAPIWGDLGNMQFDSPTIHPSLVTGVPLFAGFEELELRALLAIFQRQRFEDGELVSKTGDEARHLRILISGKLSVQDESGEILEVCPPAPVGELSALTDGRHSLNVFSCGASSLLAAPIDRLQEFLIGSAGTSRILHRNLLLLAAQKMARDRRRLREMRRNIVRTQHAMKRMRAALEAGEDTPLHTELFDELVRLIEQNRKVHYLVEPSQLASTQLHLANGETQPVIALSQQWLHVFKPSVPLVAGQEVCGYLSLDGAEIPISGRVVHVDEREARMSLDEMVPEYREILQAHLAKSQLLDTVL